MPTYVARHTWTEDWDKELNSCLLGVSSPRQVSAADFISCYPEIEFELDSEGEKLELIEVRDKELEQYPDIEGNRPILMAPIDFLGQDEERLDTFFAAYLECALWASDDDSTPQGGEPLDKNHTAEDIADETLDKMREDCIDFMTAHPEESDIPAMLSVLDDDGLKRAGYDFWLTRNRHGAGFWDGDWDNLKKFGGEGANWGEALTKRSEPYGAFDLYIGDDGKVYGC